MVEDDHLSKLADVFYDASSHRLVASIIRDHLTNRRDVRREALNGFDLSGVKTILDLGCGFGFFTEGLQGKVSAQASATGIDRHEKYAKFYADTCQKVGIKSRFSSSGISSINKFRSGEFDLILCSYALYFFPEFIPEIARVIGDDGVFIAITHARPHMKEFTTMVRQALASRKIPYPNALPYESLIDRFCDENGEKLLSPWFRKILKKTYMSEIVFQRVDYEGFEEYFRFKRSFFMPEKEADEEALMEYILKKVKEHLDEKGSLHITRDDAIFICSQPVKKIHEP